MPPVEPDPDKIQRWEPVPKPSSRPPKPNSDLARYEQARTEWKDSSPAYRHVNPRPETWIPHRIVETNYRIPTAEEKDQVRQEYLEIVEEIKDQIPPEYYWDAQERYSKPPEPDREGPDGTGMVDGYDPGMMTHPRFREKDHTRYHALPREKMLPKMEKHYKTQEVHQVKENLDVLEDDGVDYAERMSAKKKRQRELDMEEERRVREEVFRGTHWVDWETGKNGWIPDPADQEGDHAIHPSPTSKPQVSSEECLKTPPIQAPSGPGGIGKESDKGNESNVIRGLIAFAIGGTVISALYGVWKLAAGMREKQREITRKNNQYVIVRETGVKKQKRKSYLREWHKE